MEEDDEIRIEDDSDASAIPESSQADAEQDVPLIDIRPVVNKFKEILPTIKVTVSEDQSITVDIPNTILPLSLIAVYGFYSSQSLLIMKLTLHRGHWDMKPDKISITHPVYGTNFIGKPLITKLIDTFFSHEYRKKELYHSLAYLFSMKGKIDQSQVQKLAKKGYDKAKAEAALALCGGNFSQALEYLSTGEISVSIHILPKEYSANPLFLLLLEISDTFFSLMNHCCICGEKLPIKGLKPSVCISNPLCTFAFEQIGVGYSLIQEIRRDPAVADLMISAFGSAWNQQFMDPAPPAQLSSAAEHLLSTLPPVMTIAQQYQTDSELLKAIGKESFSLLRWIILSNRSHLISLPDKLRLTEFPGHLQFLSLISTPEAELTFRAKAQKHGSVFLWHGSSGDRWHSILRNGLKNASGTKLEAHGAAYGSGIYLASNMSASYGYVQGTPNAYKRSIFSPYLSLIALCEVAKVKELVLHKPASYYTLTDESACIVRCVFCGNPMSYDTVVHPLSRIPSLQDVLDQMANQLAGFIK